MTYHFDFILFERNDIASICPIASIEERESQISDLAVRKCLKLHAEILDFRIKRFDHHRSLLSDDVTEPATLVV